jgi:hypothetical protein
MKQSGRLFPGRPGEPLDSRRVNRQGITLALEDDQAFKERGYNPYDTTAHARDMRRGDIWRHKPKRA